MNNIFLGNPPENIVKWIREEAERKMLRTPLTFTAEQANSTVRMASGASSAPAVYLETSRTGEEGSWTDFTVGSTTITLANVGDKVYFRAKQDNASFGNMDDYNYFVMTGKIAASGNLNTLLKADGSVLDLTGRDYCYYNMFEGCSSLTKAPALPATTLAEDCYGSIFRDCKSLTQASFPNLGKDTVSTEVVINQYAFAGAANDIETTCLDGTLVINSTAA